MGFKWGFGSGKRPKCIGYRTEIINGQEVQVQIYESAEAHGSHEGVQRRPTLSRVGKVDSLISAGAAVEEVDKLRRKEYESHGRWKFRK